MGTELMRICVKEDNEEFPSVPPGFESFSSFSLKRVEGNEKYDENMITCSTSTIMEAQSVKSETDGQGGNDVKNPRSLRRKHCINHGRLDRSSEEESDFEQHDHILSSRLCLPKGVIRGCPACNNCQKVVARWRPENARRPNLEDAPVFFPSEEEFEDTLSFISSIREKAEPYGICKIVPPPSWKPPCPLKERDIWEHSKFSTRVQRIDKLQNRDSMKKISKPRNNTRRKRRRCARMEVDCGNTGVSDVEKIEVESFGFEPGQEFTLGTFQRYASDFKARYFRKNENMCSTVDNETGPDNYWEPSVEDLEGEYWRMVEKPTEEIEVLYGADLETGVFGSGFPRQSGERTSALDEKYLKSGWNLNNFPRLRGSVLSYESSDISGVLVPWLYIGMCFSSFCWHVEDHHLYSLNYMHWGAPKMWYGVPGKEASKLEEVMKKHLPDLFEEQPDLLHKLVTQLSPSILKSDGVPVYRCVQNAGEFVLTFPRAYHSGFNCGFNCAEAVNVAPVDWLPYGQIAIELYREQGRRTSISHDKLLLGAARDAVRAHWELNLLKKNTLDNLRWKDFCGKDGILAKALKSRVEMERVSRESICSASQALKMDSSFDANNERECSVCLFDLHLSAAGCHCCPDRYACLNHAKQFCSCAWDSKYFLFRYDISELNILVDALEGKLSSVYRWARLDLGLALTSYVSKDHLQYGTLSQSSKEIAVKELKPQISMLRPMGQKEVSLQCSSISIKDHQRMHESRRIGEISMKKPDESSGCQVEVLSPVKNEKSLISPSSSVAIPDHAKKEESAGLSSNLRPICQISQEFQSYSLSPAAEEPESKKALGSESDNIILVSDDEGDEESNLSESDKKMALPEKLNDNSWMKEEKPILTAPVLNAVSMVENDAVSLPDEKLNSPLTDPINKEAHTGISQPHLPCNIGCTIAEPESNSNVLTKEHNSRLDNSDKCPQNALQSCCIKPSLEDRNEILGACVNSNSAENTISANASSSHNADRNHRQGLRIAKVIRRINRTVEPLEYGVVLSGKSWCNSQAIFPKGFRSRVRYTSVLDPTKMCYYISEIAEARSSGPLFMVSVENCPSEVFIHISASRCWDMVRERLNQEIAKQYRLGRLNLPPLLPPGSVDGFEMFGFSSPAIVQAIEAMDRNRVCSEYWGSRPYSRPPLQILHSSSQSTDNGKDFHRNQPLSSGSNEVLRGLFRKADLEELKSLYSFLSENKLPEVQRLIMQLLQEESH